MRSFHEVYEVNTSRLGYPDLMFHVRSYSSDFGYMW